jgi:hypothetical protein
LVGGALAFQASAAPAEACTALRKAYQEALPAAQVCDAKSPKACAAQRVAALEDACRCPVSVNPGRTRQLDGLIAKYKAQGCAATQPSFCNRACPAPDPQCGGEAGTAPHCGQR